MIFQRFKMQRSVQLLEAKGMIMDFAPLLMTADNRLEGDNKSLGMMHGLVGGTDDDLRAMKMVDDAFDFFGAPSIMKVVENERKESVLNFDKVAFKYEDNRDFSILNFIIGGEKKYGVNAHWDNRNEMVKKSYIRGQLHAILVRAILITTSAKPL